jgi:hypothetical protein
MKKGQVTTFIIVGLIILMVATIVYTNRDKIIITQEPNAFPEVQNYVDNCLKDVIDDAILFVGNQGGYYDTPDDYTFFYSNTIRIPVYSETHPELAEIETSLSNYVQDKWQDHCNLEIIEGVNLVYDNLTVSTTISDSKIIFDVNFPIDIKVGDKSEHVEFFSVDVPSKLKIMYDQAVFLNGEVNKENGLCISCIIELGEKYGLEVKDFGNVETGTTTIQFIDYDHLLKDKPQSYWFAYKQEPKTQEVWWEW